MVVGVIVVVIVAGVVTVVVVEIDGVFTTCCWLRRQYVFVSSRAFVRSTCGIPLRRDGALRSTI
jgi:hypothetical protein